MAELGLTIQSTLAAYQLPGASSAYFTKVYRGEPQSLMPTAGQPLVRWKVDRSEVPPEGARVLTGRRATVVVFAVECFWPLSGMEGAQQSHEDDIATVLVDLPTKFIALTPTSYTVGGYSVAAITVEDTSPVERTIPFPNVSDAEMRVLRFEVHARILEA